METIENIITLLDERTLPREEWTHANHLRVGLYYVLKFPLYEAISHTKCTLIRYNQSIFSCTMKYHETKTVFWVMQIAQFVQNNANLTFEDMEAKLLASKLNDNKYVREFYTDAILESAQSRAIYVPPDKIK